ncbi:MAG TPA: 3-isopropylmalate dehydratase small subunit [Micromonosporaceae bacterium]|jgi:3-isopropylmalate/(R)-2-methylmalate dehydratase small subunit|nr:3-isopropylmalate dehydratase small subunit [Micromonosporaceae bacterium]
MDKVTVHTGTALPLRRSDVDTDQIIPAVYLKRITKTGFEDGLFRAWRDNDPNFPLEKPEFVGASILIAGRQFGTGSSREHAVWALRDWGMRAVIAPSFGDIFRGNALKEGLVPVTLPSDAVETLWSIVEANPSTKVTVDVMTREVRVDAQSWGFPLDDFARTRLVEGLDDIALTLRADGVIADFEASRASFLPVVR